jgi:glycosyltransferase involved in cell wall biosynthesis
MRVLYLNPFSQEVSGPDESLRGLLGALIPAGVEAHVVLPAPGPQIPRYEAVGATVHVLPLAVLSRDLASRAGVLYPARLAWSVGRLVALARRLRPALIHTNMEVLLEGGLAARALRLPHVLHYRGNTLDEPRLLFDALTATWTALADHVYCISQATAGVFQRRGRGAKVEVLYNPVDVRAFADARRSDEVRASLGAGAGDLLIGTVGRVHPRKDVETFVRAAAIVARGEPRARFAVVGKAEGAVEQAYEQRVQALARASGLDGRITFAGARRDIPAVMKALDLFVLTSRHEGFGRVVAEAMAAARPIVVTREGALPELVEEDRFGLTAGPADPAEFAARIVRLCAEPAFAQAMAGRAGDRARAFDARVTGERVLARYRSLVLR